MRLKYLFSFLIFLFFLPQIHQLQAQTSPYRLKPALDISFSVGGLAGLGTSYYLEKKLQPLTEANIQALDRNRIPKFDRIAASQWDLKAKTTSDILLFGSMAMAPAIILANSNMRQDLKTTAVIGLETFFINLALTNLTKSLAHRTRPFVYNPNAPMSKKMEKDARLSFFSGHTSTVASMSFMSAQMLQDYTRAYHPENQKYMPFVWGAAAALPALTGYLRVKAGKHFPTDVLTGYLVGTAVGLLVPRLHRK
ncbi:MAG: phosphatase PAP2 family protein [Bacteroidia bacterium]